MFFIGYWGEDLEGDIGIIKWRGGKDVFIEVESSSIIFVIIEEIKLVFMFVYIVVVLSIIKGFIV